MTNEELTSKVLRLERIFAGNIQAHEQRIAAEKRQHDLDHERENIKPQNWEKHVAQARADEEREKLMPRRQS